MTTHAFKHEPRKRLTDQQRAKLFLDAGGKCAGCTRKIRIGEVWEADHVIALEAGGDNSRWQVLCPFCHKAKSADDHKQAAKGREVAVSLIVPNKHRQKTRLRRPPGMKFDWRKGRYEKAP